MKILFLADAVFEDVPGGSRMVAGELAHGLVGRGHDVTFLVARHNDHAPDEERLADGVRVVRYGGAGRPLEFMRRGQEACAKLLAESARPFDLVHTHFAYAALGPLRVIPRSVPRVRTFHGPWDAEAWAEESQRTGMVNSVKASVKRGIRYRVEIASLRGSAQVLTLSDYFRRLVCERSCVAPEKITVIPGGADSIRFQPAEDPILCRRELGLPLDRRILISVRRLTPRMGLDNLIRAIPAILRRYPDVLLLIGGAGPEQGKLQELIHSLGLECHVRLTGFIPEERLATYYQAADLFVLPTLALEGFGLVTTEALACGLPVVGTPVGATPEILGKLDPRLIASGSSSQALSEAILDFFEGPWAASLTPDRLHRYVAEHYSWNSHIAATEAVYGSLLEKPVQEKYMEPSAVATTRSG